MVTDMRDPGRDDNEMLAAEYVLGVLDAATREQVAQRMKTDANLRRAVLYWENQFAPLAKDVEAVEPPPSVLKGIEDRLFAEKVQRVSWWQSLGFWRGLSLASLAAVGIMGAVLMTTLQRDEAGGALVAQVQSENKALQLAALYDAKAGTLTVNRVEGQAVSGRVLELWLIAGNNPPVSLGVLPADARGVISVKPEVRAALKDGVLAISDEPTGGSPTGQPTGAVLATGKLITLS